MGPLWFRSLCILQVLCMTMVSQTEGSKRTKREWILPATKLTENVDYTKKEFIAKIWSDKHTEDEPVEYSLTGHGADKEPYNLFVVNPQNGLVRITAVLDREERSEYNLKGLARYRNGSLAEGEVHLKIQVLDQNDNPPKFTLAQGSVAECSKIGSPVMLIRAEDADEPGSINTKIAYSIVKQIPDGDGSMFSIDRNTGDLYVKQHTLDRETHDSYMLIVQGVDMDGAPDGNTGTGTVEIKVLDINDNVPILEKDEHTDHVNEDAVDMVVMRIKALDKDLEFTDNWLVRFIIIEGNEGEFFTIETDPKTNEGILKLVKPLDYEKVQELNLSLAISNVAPLINGTAASVDSDLGTTGAGTGLAGGGGGQAGGGADGVEGGGGGAAEGVAGTGASVKPGVIISHQPGGKRYTVKILVNNVADGLAFSPSEKKFPVSEDPKKIQVPKIIGSFPALDGDTGKSAENVRYAKGYDPENWLSINQETSEIQLVKVPDRESKFLVNGTYYAKILCMTQDVPPKTVTGTVALKVEDANDHCPRLTSNYESICSDTTIINVTAFDQDVYPNAEPYTFVLTEEETHGEWEIVPVNGTTVSFHAKDFLWPGFYELTMEIFDVQGLGCEEKQKVQVEVCTCEEGDTCVVALRAAQQHLSSVKVGVPAIGLLMASLALLMLVPMLLLFCQCGVVNEFMELPFDAKEHLISYHTESKGEDKEVPPLNVPDQQPMAGGAFAGSKAPTVSSTQVYKRAMEIESMLAYRNNTFSTGSNFYSSSFRPEKDDVYGGIALPDSFLHEYFTQKARFAAENPPLTDSLLVYNYEGQDSPVGSLDCCNLLESGNDMTFLNGLGPKFMALAEICSPSKPSPPPPSVEQIVQTVDHTVKSESCVSTSTVTFSEPAPSPPEQSKVDTEALNNSDTPHTMNANPIQLVAQQPLYYLVEHQAPRTVIIAERPRQDAYLINGSAGTRELILQDSNPAQASLSGVQQGTYLIRETSVLQENSLTNLSVPSSPGSPTSPIVLVKGSCLQHHDSASQSTFPVMQSLILLQSEDHVVPAVLSQACAKKEAQGISAEYPGEIGNVMFVQDQNALSPQRSTEAHTDLQSQDSSVRFSPAFVQDREQFSKQVDTDYTADVTQMAISTQMNVMHSISSELPLVRSSTADVQAKANAIRKELEEAMLIQGFSKHAIPNSEDQEGNQPVGAISVSQEDAGQIKDVGMIMINSEVTQEPICEQSLINQDEEEPEFVASPTPDLELNDGPDQELAEASDVTLETPDVILEIGTEVGIVTDLQVTVFTNEEDLKPEPEQIKPEAVKENEDSPNKANMNVGHLEEISAAVEESESTVTQEVVSEQNLLILYSKKEVKLSDSDTEREDAGGEPRSSTQTTDTSSMEEEDLNEESVQIPVEELDINPEVPQCISGVNLEVDTGVGVVPDVLIALPPEAVKRGLKPEEQNTEEVKENGHGPNQIDARVKSCLIGDKLKSEDVGDQLELSMQINEDNLVMEQVEITQAGVNDELDQELVETLQNPAHMQQSAPVDPQSNEESDLEGVISHRSTELEQVIAMKEYIELLEVHSVEEIQVQVSPGQTNPQGTGHGSIQNESSVPKICSEIREMMEKDLDKESAHSVPGCQTPASLRFQEEVDRPEDISRMQVETDTEAGEGVLGLQVAVLTEEKVHSSRREQLEVMVNLEDHEEATVLTCQTMDLEKDEDLSGQEKYGLEQDIQPSAMETCAQITANDSIKTTGAWHRPQIEELGEDEVTLEPESADNSQSALTNLKSVRDGLELEDKAKQILPQAETKSCTLQSLSKEGDSSPDMDRSEISETSTRAEKEGDVLSEATEQVLATVSTAPESGSAGSQAKSEEETPVSPENKRRGSKKSAKKETSPKSPVGKCKPQ